MDRCSRCDAQCRRAVICKVCFASVCEQCASKSRSYSFGRYNLCSRCDNVRGDAAEKLTKLKKAETAILTKWLKRSREVGDG